MTASSKQKEKFINLLRELFQLNQPDLDFGLYRIMHAKSEEIEKFLNEDLLGLIEKTFAGGVDEKISRAKDTFEQELKNATEYGVPDPGNSPKVQQALAAYNDVRNSAGEDAEIYDHLYRFFERYYDQGDFLSRRYYARETSEKAAPYAVPYDGSEVYLHWANKDQYYIKTTESFNQFSFDLALAQDADTQLFADSTSLKVHFKLVDAEEGEHNNVKASSDKDRYFIVDETQPIEWGSVTEGEAELIVRFQYCVDVEKTGNANNWRNKRNLKNQEAILNALKAEAESKNTNATLVQSYYVALAREVSKGSKTGETQPLIARYLNQYTARNTMDYFIHKDLGGFLKRELDFYLKNEVLRLDDLGTADHPALDSYNSLIKKLHILRSIAHKLIDFLAQTEEFQKKLWLKKKFVVATHYCITLDRIPESFYAEIVSNEQQWAQWEELGMLENDKSDLLKQAKAGSVEYLKDHLYLMADTALFDPAFKDALLAEINDLDENLDGVLINGDNFQALNILQDRYRSKVKCIYIDPPYNTGSDGFTYKDNYQYSSWLAMLENRMSFSKSLMARDDSFVAMSIDKRQMYDGKLMLDKVLQQHKFINSIVNVNNPKGRSDQKHLPTAHDNILLYASDGAVSHGWSPSDKVLKRYRKQLEDKVYREIDLRKTGDNDRREDRENMFYPFYFNENTGELYPSEEELDSKGLIKILPMKSKTQEGCWRWEFKTAEKNISRLIAKFMPTKKQWTIFELDFLGEDERVLPTSVWDEKGFNSERATELFINLGFNKEDFPRPKPLKLMEYLLEHLNRDGELTLDFFAGSGTTGHAVIELNRKSALGYKNKGKHKYILVEQGDYFDKVLKPRIQKVVYSSDWTEGKPIAIHTGVSHAFKVLKLESYEDTLNNLLVAGGGEIQAAIDGNPNLREGYYLNYLLEMETKASPSLLNVSEFNDPTAYMLNIKSAGQDAQVSKAVDLVETFNWLVGLHVKKLHAPRTFNATLEHEVDPELPTGSATRLVLKGKLQHDVNGAWWFRSVEGFVKNTGASQREQKVLIIWRKLTGNLEKDNTVLKAYLQEVHQIAMRPASEDIPYDVIYVNGSHNLPVLAQCEVRLLEETFHQKMWDVKDV